MKSNDKSTVSSDPIRKKSNGKVSISSAAPIKSTSKPAGSSATRMKSNVRTGLPSAKGHEVEIDVSPAYLIEGNIEIGVSSADHHDVLTAVPSAISSRPSVKAAFSSSILAKARGKANVSSTIPNTPNVKTDASSADVDIRKYILIWSLIPYCITYLKAWFLCFKSSSLRVQIDLS